MALLEAHQEPRRKAKVLRKSQILIVATTRRVNDKAHKHPHATHQLHKNKYIYTCICIEIHGNSSWQSSFSTLLFLLTFNAANVQMCAKLKLLARTQRQFRYVWLAKRCKSVWRWHAHPGRINAGVSVCRCDAYEIEFIDEIVANEIK